MRRQDEDAQHRPADHAPSAARYNDRDGHPSSHRYNDDDDQHQRYKRQFESVNQSMEPGKARSANRVPAEAGRPPSKASSRGAPVIRPNLQRNNRRSLYHPPSAAAGGDGGPPEVYWSEGHTPSGYDAANGEQETFTFYREPTPEPIEKREPGVGIGGYDDSSGTDENGAKGRRRVCGMRPLVFWALVALVIVLVVGIGVGVGVGVGASPSSSSSNEASDRDQSGAGPDSENGGDGSSSSTTAAASREPSPSASGTTTTTSPSPSTTADDPDFPTETSSGALNCPQSNYTLYAVPGSQVRFLRVCGVDYRGEGAEDIGEIRTESMAECMRNCAGTFGCTGCGWGFIESAGSTDYWCWLKGDLQGQPETRSNWEFAVMQ